MADEYRLLVCGDRNWDNYLAIFREIKARMPDLVIEGGATGADNFAKRAAFDLLIPVWSFPAQWARYGRLAGPIRNREMIVRGKPTECIAFHENINKSKGTLNMIKQCNENKIPVTLYVD